MVTTVQNLRKTYRFNHGVAPSLLPRTGGYEKALYMIDEEKTCIKCGNTFRIHHPSQKHKKYCSAPCSNGYYNKTNEKVRKKK
jgi:hypothetical protein